MLGADGLVLTTASSFETDHGAGYMTIAVSRVVGLGEARTRMESTENLVVVAEGYRGSTVPLGADGLVLATAGAFETDFGHGYLTVATSRLVGLPEGWVPADTPRLRTLTLERDGGRDGDHRVVWGMEIEGPTAYPSGECIQSQRSWPPPLDPKDGAWATTGQQMLRAQMTLPRTTSHSTLLTPASAAGARSLQRLIIPTQVSKV